jgi:aspartate 1-decarboxylase
MEIQVLTFKFHCASVTQLVLGYVGSISINKDLMNAAFANTKTNRLN